MRLHLTLSPNREPVPFEYLHFLTGAFHKWLGSNDVHDDISLYSLSWLRGSQKRGGALAFPQGATWMISAHDDAVLNAVVEGIACDPAVCCGMSVVEVRSQRTPDFGSRFLFRAASPVLARGKDKVLSADGTLRDPHFTFRDEAADAVLTQTLRHKLDKAGLSSEGVFVRFDRAYKGAKTKLLRIGGTANIASLCPVIVEGTPEAVAFAWNVGAGHKTGCGFGCLA